MASATVCPVVGTTNTVLPPSHPSFDAAKPGQVCPVTNATTDHHHNLSQHPKVPESISPTPSSVTNASTSINTLSAAQCPALRGVPSTSQEKALDENVCPVVGPVTTVLPPDHPSVEDAGENTVCPVTNATLKHHKGKVVVHPPVSSTGGVCPVVGAKGSAVAGA